ncbi:MAG: hypothetical protein UT30_C0006G0039 [Candidatus Uhrbacteria bacterium GW2011_GWF2_39_13]|uniref:Uncharacterized protein n=1 Tax=Candidatus Uhrbacteria bacterium GW2011_GWF2_39_13 TaxID=1618995 RepID=A0A0G0Q289_9BACT|nr:MAG: hypothetical protein UT30_C0006G0039 [Candidatus Uhrbacteria bacterium GW2011_GWF2_39_13]
MEYRESAPPPVENKDYPEDYQELLEGLLTWREDSASTKIVLRQLQDFSEGKESIGELKGWTQQNAKDWLADYQAARKNKK